MHQEEPAWSRQGLIAYVDNGVTVVSSEGGWSVDPALMGIWVIDPVTRVKNRVLPYGYLPDWSPDGSSICFGHSYQIYTAKSDGSEVRYLTECGRNFFPRWSPDGARITFDSSCKNPSGGQVIWVISATGTNAVNISPFGVGEWRMPSWSPDGTKILHIRYGYSGAFSEIFEMNPDGTHGRRLTENDGMEYISTFSPDGTRIAYDSFGPEGGLQQVWVMNADGSSPLQLTSGEKGGAWPSWSPDGGQIVYTSSSTRIHSPESGVLWVIDVETRQEFQLTEHWPEASEQ